MGAGQGGIEGPTRWRIELTNSARKDLKRLPGHVIVRFERALDAMTEHGLGARLDFTHLARTHDSWRLRVGNHRAYFAVEDRTFVFTKFGPRPNFYS